MTTPLSGRVALVAGATRGAGRAFAVELGRAGAHVYATGRSSRTQGRSEIDRSETIEETGDLIEAAGGSGAALVVDHESPEAVRSLVDRIRRDHGRLDVLVNNVFGGDRYAQFDKPLWDHDLAGGLRMLRMGVDTHLITAHFGDPSPARERRRALRRGDRRDQRVQRRLPRGRRVLLRPGQGQRRPDRARPDPRAARPSRHRRRSYAGLAPIGEHARPLRRHRGDVARRTREGPPGSRSRSRRRTSPAGWPHWRPTPTPGGSEVGCSPHTTSPTSTAVTDADGSRPDCWGYITRHGIDEQSGNRRRGVPLRASGRPRR